jgi:DNA-binding PadR family transcriptional regulator
MHGYEIIQEITDRTGGTWSPSPGSVYPGLQRLGEEGLVDKCFEDGKISYTLNSTGRSRAAEVTRSQPPWELALEDQDPDWAQIRKQVKQLEAAVWQFREVGSEAPKKAAIVVLVNARRALHEILAEAD